MKPRHPFAPNEIPCYRLPLLQRVRRALAGLISRISHWRT